MAVPNEIITYLHCAQCVESYRKDPEGIGHVSPAEYARLSVGWTQQGLQIWCWRHQINVCHIDFESHRHPAETSA